MAIDAAVESAIAGIAAIEGTCPAFHNGLAVFARMHELTELLVATLSTDDILFHGSTIASCGHTLFTSAAGARMTT
ncbi:hypothetical protein B0A50_04907 [Salinomyces thailandicus]|uniref:Uncharacterized protein n=1 Tax=Salinomyces thailandicus TaxID=706561 RepID=A0A4U0U0F7_9PEZI|nr:hypothetical protein B0A50_04907 [Salinomyces thailandica]